MVSIYHAVNDGSLAVVSILFPLFRLLFHLSYTEVGIITGGGLFITLVAQLLLGRAADGKNSRILLSVGLCFTALCIALLTRSEDFITLLLFMFLLRLSTSFFHPVGVGLISRIFKKDRLDRAMGIQSGSADICSFIAVATTFFLKDFAGWQFPLYLWAIACFFIFLLGLALTHRIPRSYVRLPMEKEKHTLREAVQIEIRFLKRIKLLVPAFMISGSAWNVMIVYFPLLLQAKTSIPLSTIGLIVAVWVGVGGVASLFYGRIHEIVRNRQTIIVVSYLATGILSLSIIYVTFIPVLISIMILSGIAVFLTFPVLFSFVSEATHESAEGRTFAMTFTLQTGGGALLLFVSGVFSDLFGIWVPFAILGLASLLLTGLLLLNLKKPFVSSS